MQERQLNSSNQFMISSTGRQLQDRRGNRQNIPSDELGLKCPRCDSSNTKFCYYNNYNLAQPRHFCKTCKRYWTKGGALRNVPVGGGCRKNKRAKQKSADQSPASLALAVEESLLSTIHCDRPIASSSASLDFSVGSASSRQDLIFVGEEGVGLTFEKLDQGSRSFTGSSPRPPSLSINWAAAAPSTATLQPFQSSILGINLSGLHQSKQEPVNLCNNGDLSSIFDPQLSLLGQTSPQLTDNLRSYNNQLGLDSFGLMQASPSNGDIQWRLPPPRLVTMVEGAHGYPDGRLLRHHTSVENLQPDNLRNTRKLSIPEEMQVSTMAENQEADRLPVMWQPHPEASLFDTTTGDGSAYWSSSSWPQNEMYEDDQLG